MMYDFRTYQPIHYVRSHNFDFDRVICIIRFHWLPNYVSKQLLHLIFSGQSYSILTLLTLRRFENVNLKFSFMI